MAEPAAKQFEKAAQRLGTWQAEEATLERNRIGFPIGDQKRLGGLAAAQMTSRPRPS